MENQVYARDKTFDIIGENWTIQSLISVSKSMWNLSNPKLICLAVQKGYLFLRLDFSQFLNKLFAVSFSGAKARNWKKKYAIS